MKLVKYFVEEKPPGGWPTLIPLPLLRDETERQIFSCALVFGTLAPGWVLLFGSVLNMTVERMPEGPEVELEPEHLH